MKVVNSEQVINQECYQDGGEQNRDNYERPMTSPHALSENIPQEFRITKTSKPLFYRTS